MSIEDCRGFPEGRLTTIVGQPAPSEQLGFVFQVSTHSRLVVAIEALLG